MHSTEAPSPFQEEAVIQIPLSELHPFPNHPFKVRDDDAMRGMMESVREYGVLTPAIVRPRETGGYEIIAGHRREHASKAAGLETLPAIVRDMDNDAATILMVDKQHPAGKHPAQRKGRSVQNENGRTETPSR